VLRLLYLSLFAIEIINTPGYKEQKMVKIINKELASNCKTKKKHLIFS